MDVMKLATVVRIIKGKAFSVMDEHLDEVGLTRIEFSLLSYLYNYKSVQTSHLARQFQVSIPAVMHKLQALEKKGFCRKEVDQVDKRIKYYSLTEDFMEYYQSLYNELDRITQNYLSFLGEEGTHLERILDLTLQFLEVHND